MSDERLLLMSILSNPQEDTVRLAYADFLEENGDSIRSAFIRMQIAGGARNVPLTVLVDLEPFVGPLPHKYYTNVSGSGVAQVDYPDWRFTFRRGFICHITTTSQLWLAHADALVWHPSQTVECGRCQADGNLGWVSGSGPVTCPVCSGTGRVPRPCPPTTQPVTDVELVGEVPDGWDTYIAACHGDHFEDDRWPWIDFLARRPT